MNKYPGSFYQPRNLHFFLFSSPTTAKHGNSNDPGSPYDEAVGGAAVLFAEIFSNFKVASLVNSLMQHGTHHHPPWSNDYKFYNRANHSFFILDEFIFPPKCKPASWSWLHHSHVFSSESDAGETNPKFVTSWRDNCDTQPPQGGWRLVARNTLWPWLQTPVDLEMLQVHSPLRKVYRGCGNLGDFDFQLNWSVSGQALERVTGHCDLSTKLVTQKTASSSIALARSHTTAVSDGLGHTYGHVNIGVQFCGKNLQ